MFTTGVYQQTRGSKLLSYEENPAIFPSNPKYFEYSVMSAEEKYNQDASESNQEALEEDKQTEEGDFILQISTREPQNYGTNLKSANLRFDKSIGEMSSESIWFSRTIRLCNTMSLLSFRGPECLNG